MTNMKEMSSAHLQQPAITSSLYNLYCRLNVNSKLNFLDKRSTNDSYFCFIFFLIFFVIIFYHISAPD